MKLIHVKDEAASLDLAKQLAKFVEPGMVILLEGDLGAGKTTFTKGIAAGLNINRVIKSPTYTIIREYTDGDMPLYHMDLYRLDEDNVADLGLDEYFFGQGLSVVEWPSKAMDEMPDQYLKVVIERQESDESARSFRFEAIGDDYRKIIGKLN